MQRDKGTKIDVETVMIALRVAAWGAFGFAGIAIVLLINEGFIPYLGAALALSLTGVLLLAADKAIALLASIRDAMTVKGNPILEVGAEPVSKPVPRSATEIAGDLERLKRRH